MAHQEALAAATKAFNWWLGKPGITPQEANDHAIAEYIIGSGAALEAVKATVKPLEWEYVERETMTYTASDDCDVLYYIDQSFGSDSFYFKTIRWPEETIYDGDDLPSAQAAAQADYETRVLSALEVMNATESFQDRVQPWMMACFGEMIAGDREERNHRFLEEALELVQSIGCTAHEAHELVDYVYGRPAGEPHQEVGGVMVTLAALCLANTLDMHTAGETELARVWTKVEAIRAKQAAKPKYSPLPVALVPSPALEANQQAPVANLSDDDMALIERLDSYMGLANMQEILRDCRAAVKLIQSFSANQQVIETLRAALDVKNDDWVNRIAKWMYEAGDTDGFSVRWNSAPNAKVRASMRRQVRDVLFAISGLSLGRQTLHAALSDNPKGDGNGW